MIKTGQTYKHFKGNEYRVICVAQDCDDMCRSLVIYQPTDGGKTWAREYNEFQGMHESGVKRFELVGGRVWKK
jgi:hypothetical protein